MLEDNYKMCIRDRFLVGITFQADILLALVVVSLIYVYILVSQYKITKRYYKE